MASIIIIMCIALPCIALCTRCVSICCLSLFRQIRLRETNFYVGSLAGRAATHTDLLGVLLNVAEWSVSTAFAMNNVSHGFSATTSAASLAPHSPKDVVLNVAELLILLQDFIAFYIELAELQRAEQAGPEDVNATFFPIEVCDCPLNYTGQFCQDCASLYARPGGNLADSCTLCECYAPVDGCDASTGICLNCMDNTTGTQCESCLPGHFGDPMQGIPCQPCPCPLVDRSFSSSCFLDNDSLPTCTACEEGYTGRNCEQCVNGYFGDPLVSVHIHTVCELHH